MIKFGRDLSGYLVPIFLASGRPVVVYIRYIVASGRPVVVFIRYIVASGRPVVGHFDVFIRYIVYDYVYLIEAVFKTWVC